MIGEVERFDRLASDALDVADRALLQSDLASLQTIADALELGDRAQAIEAGALLAQQLHALPHVERLTRADALRAHAASYLNGSADLALELAGIAPPEPRDELRRLLELAAVERDDAERRRLTNLCFEQLRGMTPLEVRQWRPEFLRLLGISARDFRELNALAKRGLRLDRAASGAGVPDDGQLADRLLSRHPALSFGLGEWRLYEHGRHRAINSDIVREMLRAVLEDARPEGVRPSTRTLSSALELARIACARPGADWDAHPELLAFANRTLNIETGELLPPDPAHLLTSGLAFDYDPTAPCPVWEAFLAGSFSPEVIAFLQEFAGYALTTDCRHELAIWLWGPRGCGKSTLIGGLHAALGERAGLLGLSEIENSPFALADLPGKTLLVSTEQPAEFIRAGHKLNAIISGEPVTVDRKHRDAVTVRSRAKLLWAMNSLPRISEAGSGLFRRVKIIEMGALPEAERDLTLKERIETEAAGIVNWALAGLKRLNERGRFEIPGTVRDAVEEFERSNDPAANFLDECATRDPAGCVESADLYSRYQSWCLANGHRAKSSTAIAEDWRRLGLEKTRVPGSGRMAWLGARWL